jgi:hypothetical protein
VVFPLGLTTTLPPSSAECASPRAYCFPMSERSLRENIYVPGEILPG